METIMWKRSEQTQKASGCIYNWPLSKENGRYKTNNVLVDGWLQCTVCTDEKF